MCAQACSNRKKEDAAHPPPVGARDAGDKQESLHGSLLVERDHYYFGVPPRFTIAEGGIFARLAEGGVALVGYPDKSGRRPTIVVGPVPNYDHDQPMNLATCREAATKVAQGTGAHLERVGLAPLSIGKSCQYLLRDEKTLTISTMMLSSEAVFLVNCTLRGEDDEAGKNGCNEVLKAWRFKKPGEPIE